MEQVHELCQAPAPDIQDKCGQRVRLMPCKRQAQQRLASFDLPGWFNVKLV